MRWISRRLRVECQVRRAPLCLVAQEREAGDNAAMRRFFAIAAAVLLLGCSDSQPAASSSSDFPVPQTAPPAVQKPAPEPLADVPRTIARTPRPSMMRKGQDGETREWALLHGIEVSDEHYKVVYQSQGASFLSFRASVKVAGTNCLVHWKAQFLESETGQGELVASVEGTVPGHKGKSMMVSGILELPPEQASKIGSASVGYWTLCGDALPTPSEFDVAITETKAEQIKLGTLFDLHHTLLRVKSKGKASKKRRCYFDLVVEDEDADGFTLNRDFASFSLFPGTNGEAKIRRTVFEGGRAKDYEGKAKGKRSYIRKLSCASAWDESSSTMEGLHVSKLALHRYEGEPTTAEHFVRASYAHSATLRNTTGKNCSFRVRYRLLDSHGIPMHRTPLLSEQLHIAKDATVQYRSKRERLFVWLSQAPKVGSLVIERATPVDNCQRYDAKRALQASNEAVGSTGNQNKE